MSRIGILPYEITAYDNERGEYTKIIGDQTLYRETTTLTGIWAAAQNLTLNFQKVGRHVTLSFADALAVANANAIITVTLAIPYQYLPQYINTGSCTVVDNGVAMDGHFRVTPAGVLEFWTGLDVAPGSTFFTGAGISGVRAGTISWNTRT